MKSFSGFLRHCECERRVLNILVEDKDLFNCFSSMNKEQFDQTFLKFGGEE